MLDQNIGMSDQILQHLLPVSVDPRRVQAYGRMGKKTKDRVLFLHAGATCLELSGRE